MESVKNEIKQFVKKFSLTSNFIHARSLYPYYKNLKKENKLVYLLSHDFYIERKGLNKSAQIASLIDKIDINPVDNKTFFYSIDCFKSLELTHRILENYSIDYSQVVHGSLEEIAEDLKLKDSEYAKNELTVIEALRKYYERCASNPDIMKHYSESLAAIESLFCRPANTFYEGLQRILFINQFLWQTKHKHNGFGHLDWILGDLYESDLKAGAITEEMAILMLKDFFRVLHENSWFKSTMLLGDTGQIIILGGLQADGKYYCNKLTYLLIEVSKELKLPDPKVLLRCSESMPDELLILAIECIATGIGSPFLSNDDAVIPSLIKFGYTEEDSYNYATAACWEPLIINDSCDQNNIRTINFAIPLVHAMDDKRFNTVGSLDGLLTIYYEYLDKYLEDVLSELCSTEFEIDPLFSLFSLSSREQEVDIVKGGARYSNLGVTSVGMGTVVDSMLNIVDLVFDSKVYSIRELNDARKVNYNNREEVQKILKDSKNKYGNDSKMAIELTNQIMNHTSSVFSNYKTSLGGKFKFGLSSPNYIVDGTKTSATLDGRNDYNPFNVHISNTNAAPITELLNFAMKLDYTGNKVNGNVVDFVISPTMLVGNKNKFITLIKAAFKNGVFQMQMNVIDSATLIDAKINPDKYKSLVVRVWGFSAYFNELPEEYKDILIARALESEKVSL